MIHAGEAEACSAAEVDVAEDGHASAPLDQPQLEKFMRGQ